MTLDRDLDRRLVLWLDERAVASPPPELLARSLLRVDRVRQRPSLLTVGAYERPWIGVGRAPVAAPLLLILAVLLVLLVVIVGSQLVVPRLTVIVPPTPSPGPLSTAPNTHEPTATPIDTRQPAFAVQASIFKTAWDPDPSGDAVAWIRTDDAIYRTEDAGLTWRTVQPEGFSKPFAAAFPDAQTAYVNVGDGTTIAFTHDGGASWTTRTLDAGDAIGPIITFRDALTGAVTYVDPALESAPDGLGLIIFSTTDGGASWTGPIRGTQPRIPDGLSKIEPPIGSFLVDSSGKAPGKTYHNDFYMSGDGGITWQKYTFPINSISRPNNLKNVDAILQEPNGRLLVEFSASPDGPGGHPNGIYESTDDPSTWRLLYTESAVGGGSVQFLSPTTWILRWGAPSGILSTFDAGATWSSVTPTMDLYFAGTPVFGSATTAWFTIDCRRVPDQVDCDRAEGSRRLFVTTDGGATWREVGG